jgi:isopenicillin N synthase-like dioxygenase
MIQISDSFSQLDVDSSSTTSDLTVRLTACTNPAPIHDARMDAMRVWDASELMTASAAECAILCDSLRSNGYIFVRITEEELAIHRRSRQAISEFWNLPVDEKNKYYIGDSSRRWGYRRLEYLNKEYFKIRKTHGMTWPVDGVLKQLAIAEYEMFNSVLKKLLRGVGRHIGFDSELENMLNYPPSLPLDRENATSFSEAFMYGENPTDQYVEPCPMHSDMGLLTIIPPGDGPPALELFSWQHGWQNVEASYVMRNDGHVCVVFPGDLLSAITNDFFQATPHRVVVRNTTNNDPILFCAEFSVVYVVRCPREADCANPSSLRFFPILTTSSIAQSCRSLLQANQIQPPKVLEKCFMQ